MNNEETVKLCQIIAQLAPAQKFDNLTPITWQPLLAELRDVDAREAVKRVAARQPFIAPADIIAEVRTLRADRIRNGPDFDPEAYPGCEDTGRAYREARQDHARRLADGEPPLPAPPRLIRSRPVAELLAGLTDQATDLGDRR